MMEYFRNKKILLVIAALVLISVVLLQLVGGQQAINPYKDKNRTAEEGRDFAALYMQGELYKAVDANEDVMGQIRADLLTFARTTRPEFADKEALVGFTFDKNFNKEDDTYIFTGRYYGLKDNIQVKLTPHGRGVYTLSVTNLKDQANIDASLKMNGKRNQYITTLPVEKPFYSIRYQLTQDRIVVSFYDGYTSSDVNEAQEHITTGLGDDTKDVVYSINRIGIVSFDKVRENLVNPLPIP